jgi:hypothetical protein
MEGQYMPQPTRITILNVVLDSAYTLEKQISR